ncbi:hypothetical protein KIN20_014363 [Parelaphostrongylus tenuis]|uniref:Uncharacterized protein n=1 Tax=Parelaphostrongylus tenuis TaxID=148309 RepID=A0AAD5MZG2_PARTN|nr:hypothetical protein KIN20_014363 [Parelaphostrongylus tenuis]
MVNKEMPTAKGKSRAEQRITSVRSKEAEFFKKRELMEQAFKMIKVMRALTEADNFERALKKLTKLYAKINRYYSPPPCSIERKRRKKRFRKQVTFKEPEEMRRKKRSPDYVPSKEAGKNNITSGYCLTGSEMCNGDYTSETGRLLCIRAENIYVSNSQLNEVLR